VITLASDFGSPYPAAMRGVICRRSNARLVDVAHDFPRGDVRQAAFWLRFVLPEFPPAVHLAVVDPGVGTGRAALAVRAGDHVLVGPDNGLLVPAARRLARFEGGGDGTRRTDVDSVGESPARDPDPLDVYRVTIETPRSTTFHGRDVFAPAAAAAHVAVAGERHEDGTADGSALRNQPAGERRPADGTDGRGTERSDWRPDALSSVDGVEPVDPTDVVDLQFPTATVTDEGTTGEVLVVDGFGNVITNVPGRTLSDRSAVTVDGGRRVPVVDTFGDVSPGEPLATVGSHGNVELDVNDGRGDDTFRLAPGDTVRLQFD
jgi:hypothetical protein